MNLYFVTPAWQRFELSAICFEQRKWAIEKLAEAGIEAHCVIVADDLNIALAEACGFETVVSENDWLGKRFNDGYQHAAEHGATHVFPIGSDSWVHPDFIIQAVEEFDYPLGNYRLSTLASRHYTRVNEQGTWRKQLWVPVLQGVSYVMPVAALAMSGYRPCADEIKSGCDGSTWKTVSQVPGSNVVWSEAHELETIAFESWPQITGFDKLGVRWGVSETDLPFNDLTDIYPDDLVAWVMRFYEKRRSMAAMEKEQRQRDEVRVQEIVTQVISEGNVPSAYRAGAKVLVGKAVRLALDIE